MTEDQRRRLALADRMLRRLASPGSTPHGRLEESLRALRDRVPQAWELDARRAEAATQLHEWIARKRWLRERLHAEVLDRIAPVAHAIVVRLPELGPSLRVPTRRMADEVFVEATRALMAGMKDHWRCFQEYGLPSSVLGDLGLWATEFARLLAVTGRELPQDLAKLRGEVQRVLREVLVLMEEIDALMVTSCYGHPERLREWREMRCEC